MKDISSKSQYGGYGAALRVGIAANDNGKVEVTYVNPRWTGNVYRMESDLADFADLLKTTLGFVKFFGHKKGLKASKLRKYQYAVWSSESR